MSALEEATEFVDRIDADALDRGKWEYRSPHGKTVQERLEWHRSACVGSIDWFSHGQAALAKLGQSSEVYYRAVKNGQECLSEIDRLIAALDAKP